MITRMNLARKIRKQVAGKLSKRLELLLARGYQHGYLTKPLEVTTDEEFKVMPGLGPTSLLEIRRVFPKPIPMTIRDYNGQVIEKTFGQIIIFPGFEELRFAAHHNQHGWRVTELSTKSYIEASVQKELSESIEQARLVLERNGLEFVRAAIKKALAIQATDRLASSEYYKAIGQPEVKA